MKPSLWKTQCKECPAKVPKVRVEDSGMDSITRNLLHLFALQRGGYPFERDDLSSEEWIALGIVREEHELSLRPPMFSVAGPTK